MGSLIKRDRLRFGEAFQKGSFCNETFYNVYKNLIQMPNTLSEMPSLGFYQNLAKCAVPMSLVKMSSLICLGSLDGMATKRVNLICCHVAPKAKRAAISGRIEAKFCFILTKHFVKVNEWHHTRMTFIYKMTFGIDI